MAHKIFETPKGVHSFASRKEKAWHGLGQVVDAMNSKDAIVLGGLDFTIEKRRLYIEHGIMDFETAKESKHIARLKRTADNVYKELIAVPDRYATVRTDTGFPLGIVSERYEVIQNIEAFDFIDSIIGEGVADYETVGALGNGGTVFITCKLREEMVINKDQIDKYLLITMAHDGTASIVVMFTPIRVVCNNTLSAALEGKSNKVTIRHTKNAKVKLEASKKILGIVDVESRLYTEAFGELFKRYVPDNKVRPLLEYSLGLKRDEKGHLSTQANNMLIAAEKYYYKGIGQEGIIGTGYGLFNGVSGYLQNVKSYKNEEVKFKNTFSTGGVESRTRAMSMLLSNTY